MYEEMNKKLATLYQGIQSYQKTDEMISILKGQLSDLSRQETNYAVELDLEVEDVNRLNRTSFTSLLYTVLGSKEEKEKKEREEVLTAQNKLDEVIRQKEEINCKLSTLHAERTKYASCEQEYNKLFLQKFNSLKSSNTPQAQRIATFEDNISKSVHKIKELGEAISSGTVVLDRLIDVESSLTSAHGWGTWDMLGGGLISDSIKHSHINDAKAAAVEVENLLNNFKSELADIKIKSNIVIDIDEFTKFADFVFDGIFADWAVQSRINESLDSVLTVKENVDKILFRLEQMQSNEENTIASLNENLNNYIREL